ncbi:uncharacterized protein EDB91DRAFT_699009 [Suillus paluster]|uniref:uncharacterized protein n=1 Tax=Suillus paluster TaxID=48578 RepID=UPI001B8649CC|nr:uncharacterized protein EDB91DRAFT_699009 [Suillus paluster]KAG1750621.1 hypothetical protein EDB91DRAFT_699009 [Suillus paluster]
MIAISSEDTTTNFDPRLVIGPMQVGALVTAALFGCLVIQTYVYFTRFIDSSSFKATVAAVVLFQLGHFFTVIFTMWTMTVTAYGDPSKLDVLPVSAIITVLLSNVTAFIAQSFYTYRLWKLSGKVFFPILSEIFCVVAELATLFVVIKAFSMTSIAHFLVEQNVWIMIGFTSRAICDITITVGVTWSLKKQKQAQGRHIVETTTIIDCLILWTIENGLATSLMSLSVMAACLYLQGTYVWFGLYIIQANVFANALLVSLNRRLVFRKCDDGIPMNPVMIRVDVPRTQAEPEVKTQGPS